MAPVRAVRAVGAVWAVAPVRVAPLAVEGRGEAALVVEDWVAAVATTHYRRR